MENKQELLQYMDKLNGERAALFYEMEEYAAANHIPIIEKESFEVILQILHSYSPNSILEIGTAIGYSALRMAYELPGTKVVSLERDKARYEQALHFRQRSELSQKTFFIYTDALDDSFTLDNDPPFDVLFIDAAKGQNHSFFNKFTSYLKDNGLIIVDNVLFKGFVTAPDQAPRRIRSMVRKLHAFNDWLCQHPDYEVKFLAVGDGLAICRKK